MQGSNSTQVKICCIASIEEARLAIECGAHALGLVSEMPSGPGVIPDALIEEIANCLGGSVRSFLLTSRRSAAGIVEQCRRIRATAVQICDRPYESAYSEIRAALPDLEIVQVVHVTGEDALEEAVRVAPRVDALLLDSGSQSLAVPELGGTGRRHDWQISRRIRDQVNVPVYLAGGLRPENVEEAIAVVQPYGLDVCTGVRTDGRLDRKRLQAFFQAVRSA